MKKVISLIGVICLILVSIINIIYTAVLDKSEHITIVSNTYIYIIGNILLAIFIYVVTNIIERKIISIDYKSKKRIRNLLFLIYAILNIAWVLAVRPAIVGDQIHAGNIAQTFYNNNLEEYLPNMTYAEIPLSQYMQSYHQQISLAFVFSLFFRIIHFDGIAILRALNVIGNVAILVALYKITMHISVKYKVNTTRLFFIILTFIPLIMLNTFIYGDIPSIALCLFSTYFIMKYSESKKIKYPIYASICTMFAYMMRMNSLIFIIATVIYLILNLLKDITKKIWKENIVNILITIIYVCISIIPSSLVQNYYLNKYNMNKDAKYPTISYFLMAMEESWRGNGWYNEDRGEYALKNIDKAKIEYIDKIKNRLKYFAENKRYAFDFYTKKLASMWSENTYSSIRSNIVGDDDQIEKFTGAITFYQKAILILMCTCIIVFLIQNRKDLSLDVIFLLTIFIGGFLFHILWEAKSRYIVPYIVVLIPMASLHINCKQICNNMITKIIKKCRKI